jgi:hypothetical protein
MHTEPTLDVLDRVTTSLGNSLREFEEKTCALFQTRELERERAARYRRRETKIADVPKPTALSNNARKPKRLNLKTYKLHALGDYVSTIRCVGTTDSYSTQSVSLDCLIGNLHGLIGYQGELEHRTSKARYMRTNRRSVPTQLSKIERRQSRIHAIRERTHRPSDQSPPEDVINNPQVQYNIGKAQNSPVHVPTFLQKNDGDPAVKVSL